MRREDLDRVGDATLVKRLSELLAAKNAIEIELTATTFEYVKRRAAVVRSGGVIGGALAEPLALPDNVRAAMARREQLAEAHHEADVALERDPIARKLLA
jgi:hypothetical protein